MGLRFFRRVKILPGLWVNFSKSGASLSVGRRGARVTFGPRGTRTTLGIPGTGLSYTTTSSRRSRRRGARRRAPTGPVRVENRLHLGFWRRLVTPEPEEAFVDGCRALAEGDAERAMGLLRKARRVADGAFLLGFLAFSHGRLREARDALEEALRRHRGFGRLASEYGVDLTLTLPIAEGVDAQVRPSVRGARLGLVEVCQRLGDADAAREHLRRLVREVADAGDDPVVRLSLAELEAEAADRGAAWRRVLDLTERGADDAVLDAGLSLLRARAFVALELPVAARDTLTRALRRRSRLPAPLARALRLERVAAYEAMGHRGRARRELEKMLAEDPSDREVRDRLGLAG